MKHKLAWLMGGALLFAPYLAVAQSTINPNIPGNASDLTSPPLRGNFAAAFNDINKVVGIYSGPTAPLNPVQGQFWRKTNVSPQIVYQWLGTSWVSYSTFDTVNSFVTPAFGNSLLAWQQLLTGTGGLGTAGQCVTSTGPTTVPTTQNCIAAGSFVATAPLNWNSGTLTLSLNANGVGNTLIRQGIARSVMGVTGNGTANEGDIQGATDQVLRVNGAGTALGFGAIDLSKAAAATGVIQPGSMPALTGDVTNSAGSLATTVGKVNGVTYPTDASTNTVPVKTAAGAVTYEALPLSAMASLAGNSVIGSIAGGTPAALSQAQLTSLINAFTTTLPGAVPAPGTATGKLLSDGGWVPPPAGTGTVTSVAITGGAGILPTGTCTITGAGTCNLANDVSTTANIWNAAGSKILDAATVFGSAANMQSAGGCGTATVTIAITAGINYACTLVTATNFTLANPTLTSAMVGRTGCIYFTQPASGSTVTIAYGSFWASAGGSLTKTLSAALGALDRLCYYVVSTTVIDFTLATGVVH